MGQKLLPWTHPDGWVLRVGSGMGKKKCFPPSLLGKPVGKSTVRGPIFMPSWGMQVLYILDSTIYPWLTLYPPFSPFCFIHRWKIYIFLHFNRLCQLKFTRDDFLYKIIIKYLRFVSLFFSVAEPKLFFFRLRIHFSPFFWLQLQPYFST